MRFPHPSVVFCFSCNQYLNANWFRQFLQRLKPRGCDLGSSKKRISPKTRFQVIAAATWIDHWLIQLSPTELKWLGCFLWICRLNTHISRFFIWWHRPVTSLLASRSLMTSPKRMIKQKYDWLIDREKVPSPPLSPAFGQLEIAPVDDFSNTSSLSIQRDVRVCAYGR